MKPVKLDPLEQTFADALATLSTREQQALALVNLEGLSQQDASDVMGEGLTGFRMLYEAATKKASKSFELMISLGACRPRERKE